MTSHAIVVVGAGPAGVAAAVEARRMGASPLLLDATGRAGGTIRIAHEVRDVPFMVDRCTGEQVAARLAAFLTRWEIPIQPLRALRLEPDGVALLLRARTETGRAQTIHADAVVLAVGTEGVHPAIAGIDSRGTGRLVGSALRACERGIPRRAVVIGGSDVAMDQARWLRARGAEVHVLARGTLRAPSWLVQAAMREGVVVRTHASVMRGLESDAGFRLVVRERDTETSEPVDVVVAAVGRRAVVIEGTEAAVENFPGRVRIVGDATGRRARHVVAALGDGCVAAAEILAHCVGGQR